MIQISANDLTSDKTPDNENNGNDTISHDNINVKKHLNKGKLHLNDKGISSFVRNFRDFLNVFETD